MLTKILASMMIYIVAASASVLPIAAQTNAADNKIKMDVTRRGTGEKARVVVKTKAGASIKGNINRAGDDSFDLINSKTKQSQTIAYSDVEKVKKAGWSTAAKIGLGVAIGGAAALVLALLHFR